MLAIFAIIVAGLFTLAVTCIALAVEWEDDLLVYVAWLLMVLGCLLIFLVKM